MAPTFRKETMWLPSRDGLAYVVPKKDLRIVEEKVI